MILPVIRLPQPFQSTLSVRRATSCVLVSSKTPLTFQSTLSVRRATFKRCNTMSHSKISIHALRKESDRIVFDGKNKPLNFNPRSP